MPEVRQGRQEMAAPAEVVESYILGRRGSTHFPPMSPEQVGPLETVLELAKKEIPTPLLLHVQQTIWLLAAAVLAHVIRDLRVVLLPLILSIEAQGVIRVVVADGPVAGRGVLTSHGPEAVAAILAAFTLKISVVAGVVEAGVTQETQAALEIAEHWLQCNIKIVFL